MMEWIVLVPEAVALSIPIISNASDMISDSNWFGSRTLLIDSNWWNGELGNPEK